MTLFVGPKLLQNYHQTYRFLQDPIQTTAAELQPLQHGGGVPGRL